MSIAQKQESRSLVLHQFFFLYEVQQSMKASDESYMYILRLCVSIIIIIFLLLVRIFSFLT